MSRVDLRAQSYDEEAIRQRGLDRARALPARLGMNESALKGKKILEIGCGFGEHCVALQELFDADAVGIDPWPPVENGPFFGHFRWFPFDATNEEVLTLGEFDYIVSYDVMEHIQLPRVALSNIYQLLRQGGRAFLKYNLYLGARASHVAHLIDFPWCHLILSDDEIAALVKERSGRDLRPAWVNRLSYAHYLQFYREIGFEVEKEWYAWERMPIEFYEEHREHLDRYDRQELDRDFMLVTLRKSTETEARIEREAQRLLRTSRPHLTKLANRSRVAKKLLSRIALLR